MKLLQVIPLAIALLLPSAALAETAKDGAKASKPVAAHHHKTASKTKSHKDKSGKATSKKSSKTKGAKKSSKTSKASKSPKKSPKKAPAPKE